MSVLRENLTCFLKIYLLEETLLAVDGLGAPQMWEVSCGLSGTVAGLRVA